ncbi:MAG: hypothetical protein LUF35_12640 [Lachnospiraceae bacterium]|nr:hypothetical protein [Lachnospiraceae bacterium]
MKIMEMAVIPFEGCLENPVQVIKCDAVRENEPSPDGRMRVLKGYFYDVSSHSVPRLLS